MATTNQTQIGEIMAITYNQNFTGDEIQALPTGSTSDWEAACDITPTMWDNNRPIEWVLSDGLGEYFAVCTVFGGHILD
jgi:hypothetical protein